MYLTVLLVFVAALAVPTPADAQVVVKVGPQHRRYHHSYYYYHHHRYYRR
jgi:hypothetical protein